MPSLEAGRLDEARLRADAVARVADRLVDRDVAQREEAADDDHGDRGEAAEHEPRHCRVDARRGARGAPRRAVPGAARPKSHCERGPADSDSDLTAHRITQEAAMKAFRTITTSVVLATMALAPAAALAKHGADDGAGQRDDKGGTRVEGDRSGSGSGSSRLGRRGPRQRHVHRPLDRQAQGQAARRSPGDRVRGRPEPQRRDVERHDQPQRGGRRHDDRDDARSQRLLRASSGASPTARAGTPSPRGRRARPARSARRRWRSSSREVTHDPGGEALAASAARRPPPAARAAHDARRPAGETGSRSPRRRRPPSGAGAARG